MQLRDKLLILFGILVLFVAAGPVYDILKVDKNTRVIQNGNIIWSNTNSFTQTNSFLTNTYIQALNLGTNDPAVDVFPLTWASSPWNLTGVSNIVTWVNGGTQYVGWAATQNVDMAGFAMTNVSINAVTVSVTTALLMLGYPVIGQLASNTTYNFTTADSAEAIQTQISNVPLNLGASTLTFNFAAGVYTNHGLTFPSRYNGAVVFTGAVVSNNLPHTNQSTVFMSTGTVATLTAGILIQDCQAKVTIKNLKIIIPNANNNVIACVYFYGGGGYNYVQACSFIGSNGVGRLLTVDGCNGVYGQYNCFSSGQMANTVYTLGRLSIYNSITNAGLSQCAYGHYSSGGIMQRLDASLAGVSDTMVDSGGLIINSTGKVLP